MPKTKKGRESTAPRGSQYIDGQYIHTTTQKKLFYQTHICTVFRETLKPSEEFSETNMVRTMDKNLKKRQAHGIGNILEDRMTLEREKKSGKEPFRSAVYYREIVYIQRSKVKPEYFALSVDSDSGSKYYEVYKCKTKDDATKMVDYIKQAMDRPDKIISDGPVLDRVPVTEYPDMRRSLINVDFQASLESLDANGRVSTVYEVTSPTPPDGLENTPPPAHYSPILTPVVQRQQMVAAAPPPSPPRRRSPSPPPARRHHSVDDMNDVTYITFDPKTRRPMVSDDGPVYMYLARQNNKYGRQYSSNVDRIDSAYYNPSMYNGRNTDYYRY